MNTEGMLKDTVQLTEICILLHITLIDQSLFQLRKSANKIACKNVTFTVKFTSEKLFNVKKLVSLLQK